jgi:hypothetical protein
MDNLSIPFIYEITGASSEKKMYTPNAYQRKFSSSTLLLILLASAIVLLIPVGVVHGSTGHPVLGVVDAAPTPATENFATATESVFAGTNAATTDAAVAGLLTIDFGTAGTPNTVFSGAQFQLYLSKDGFSQKSATDVLYTGTTAFLVGDFAANVGTLKSVSEGANGTFYIGTLGFGPGDQVVVGPIPVKISSDYKYLKIFDGSSTSEAVSQQQLKILPGIKVSPNTGAAGTGVTINGGGFATATTIDINYTFLFTSWAGVTTNKTNLVWMAGISTGPGFFSQAATVPDAKQARNPPGFPTPTTTIIAKAVTHALVTSEHEQLTFGAGSATFTETNRQFTQVRSMFSGAIVAGANQNQLGIFGNDTGNVPNLAQPVQVFVTGQLIVAGNFSLVSSTVSFTFDNAAAGTATSNAASGYFNATLTVPNLAIGAHAVTVTNNGVVYRFNINVNPTLVLTPNHGPVGTSVSAAAYGFPANVKTFLYWDKHADNVLTEYNLVNGTTGSTGNFNVTVTFTAPHAYGGAHAVDATFSFHGATASEATISGDILAPSTFTITAVLTVTPGSVSANSKTTMSASGTGFPVTTFQVTLTTPCTATSPSAQPTTETSQSTSLRPASDPERTR